MAKRRYTYKQLCEDIKVYNQYLKEEGIPRKYAPQSWYGDTCVELHNTRSGKQICRIEIGSPRECHTAMVNNYHNLSREHKERTQ